MKAIPACALAALLTLPDPARAENWRSGWDESGDLLTLSNCPAGPGNGGPPPACLIFDCWYDGSIALRVIPGPAPVPPQSGVLLSLDGVPTLQAVLTDASNGNNPYVFRSDITRDVLEGLLSRMEGAASVGLTFDVASLNLPALSAMPMTGFPGALPDFRRQCTALSKDLPLQMAPAVAPPDQESIWHLPASGPNPDTDPQRFVDIEAISITDASALVEARRLAAVAIAEGESLAKQSGLGPIEVLAHLVPFQDGRRLLFVRLCHPTVFGITGCDTHLFRAPPGQDFLPQGESWIGGGPYWLDLGSAVGGWPDLISQPHSAGGTYVRSQVGP